MRKLLLRPRAQVDRGDRISWTGDAHVAQAASMAAFDNFAFVLQVRTDRVAPQSRRRLEITKSMPCGASHASLQNLARSANDCNGIASYCIYWTLSLVDYFRATNDTGALATYQPFADAKLEHAHVIFGDASTPLTFFGWDDRLGAGFFNASTVESQWDFVSGRCSCEVGVLVPNHPSPCSVNVALPRPSRMV